MTRDFIFDPPIPWCSADQIQSAFKEALARPIMRNWVMDVASLHSYVVELTTAQNEVFRMFILVENNQPRLCWMKVRKA